MTFAYRAALQARRTALASILVLGCSGSDGVVFAPDDASSSEGADVATILPQTGHDGSADATLPEAAVDASEPTDGGLDARDSGLHDAHADVTDADDEGVDAQPVCGADQKTCARVCVPISDPSTGCGGASCAPCDLASAIAVCTSDASPPACAIARCLGSHFDCDGAPANGCEADVAVDPRSCGRCGNDCTVGLQHATAVCMAGGSCDYAACDSGYADLDGDRSNGCETLDPFGVPEAKAGQLVAWLAQEDYVDGSRTWADRSGHHTDGTCPSSECPTRGYRALQFGGYGGFTLANTGGIFDHGFTPTVFVMARPGSATSLRAGTLIQLGFSLGAAVTPSVIMCSGPCLQTPDTWGNLWQGDPILIGASLDGAGKASLWVSAAGYHRGPFDTVGANLNPLVAGAPTVVVAPSYDGDLSEVVLFTGDVSSASRAAVWTYLNRKYGVYF